MDDLAHAGRSRRRQDAARRRMGARAGPWHCALCRPARAAHRAGRRDRARRARGDDRGRVRAAARVAARRAADLDRHRAGGWNGRTARSAQAFSAEDPESLRGPQFDAAWCDELAKWRHAEATFDMLQFGLRLGAASAPAHHHDAAADRADQAADRRSAHRGDARRHAGERARICRRRFSTRWSARYAGTRLGRQELDGEIIEERADALWTRAMIEAARVRAAPPLRRIVVGDRSAGLGAPGRRRLRHRRGGAGRGRLRSMCWTTRRVQGLRPAGWAAKAIALCRRLEADALVAEVNQGGDMVRAVMRAGRRGGAGDARCTRRAASGCAPSRSPRCTSRAGQARRPPLPALEDEMCDFGLDGLSSGALARPARCAGLGGHRVDRAAAGRAAGLPPVEKNSGPLGARISL